MLPFLLRVVLPTYKLIFHFHFPETKKVPKICHFYLWQFLTLTYKLKQRVLLSDLECTKINYKLRIAYL